MTWDPHQYLRFGAQRALPYRHLVGALEHLEPASVVDLGCGPGGLTATLLERWPRARIIGVDGAAEMIVHASRRAVAPRLSFERADILSWRAPAPVDLVLSNACFHWIDDHRSLVEHLVPLLAEHGTLAFQVPANDNAPSHTILRELCSSFRWRERLKGLPRTGVREPAWYLEELTGRDFEVTVWQTTYLHNLPGDDPVLEWVKGSTLRPILERLDESEQEAFLAGYGAELREAYPARDGWTLFPFTRTFVVATRP
jgi:trans-aconitate 2-methyltransferase